MKTVLVIHWMVSGLLIDPFPMFTMQEFDDVNACNLAKQNIGQRPGVTMFCTPKSTVPAAPGIKRKVG